MTVYDRYAPPDVWNPPEPEDYIEPEDDYDEHREYREFLKEWKGEEKEDGITSVDNGEKRQR